MEVLLDEDKVCQVGCCCCCSGVSDSLGTFETKFCKLLTTSRPPFRGYFTVIIHVQANTWPQLCFFTSDFFHIFPLHLPIAHCPRSSIATGAILSLLWCWANVCVGIHRLESRNTLQTDGPPRGEWCTSTSVITRELYYYVLCAGQAEDWDVETVRELRASSEEEGENPLCGGARPRIQASTLSTL